MFTLHSVCLLPHPLSHSNILCVSLIHCILSSVSFKPLHMLWTLFTNTYLAILLSSLPLFVSLPDWPSPAPNPSLTMQLWVPRRSPRIICYATMILNNTHRQYLLDTAEIKRKSYHGTKTNKKNQQNNIQHLNRQLNIHASQCTTRIRDDLFDILQLLQRSSQNEYPDIIINCFFCECLPVSAYLTRV